MIGRVVLLVDAMGGGGAARVASRLSAAWAEMGRQVTILTGDGGRGSCRYPLHPGGDPPGPGLAAAVPQPAAGGLAQPGAAGAPARGSSAASGPT